MPRTSIDLQVRPEHVARQERQGASFRGFFAERVIVGGAIAYDYDWVGTRNYLAIHDIELKAGEICVSNGKPDEVNDLRGRMTFAPKECPLAGWVSTVDRVNAFTSITFDADILARELDGPRAPTLEQPHIHFRSTPLEASLWKLDAALKSSALPDAVYLETLALTAVMELSRFSQDKQVETPETGRLSISSERRIRDFILSRLNDNLTLAEMADVAGLSRFHFSRAFKASFGLSPRDYLLWARVEAAKRMLAETERPISEIAAEVGFGNPDRLAASFKRFAAQTPRDYRRNPASM